MQNPMVNKSFLAFFLCIMFFQLLVCSFSDKTPSKYKLTNPVLDIFVLKEINPFSDGLETLIQSYKDKGMVTNVSVYFRSLSDGLWFGMNEQAEFSPASLLKLPIMMYAYKQAEADPRILKDEVLYVQEDTSFRQEITANKKLIFGKKYSVDTLVREMISKSDNNAAAVLLDYFGGFPALGPFFRDLGLQSFIDKNQILSLHDYCRLFRVLYNATYLNRSMSEKALSCLTECGFVDGLVAGVPPSVTIAHKFGERGFKDSTIKQLHDCGLVYYPNNPYIIGIMTQGNDYKDQEKVIQAISKYVYGEIDAQMRQKTTKRISTMD